MIMVEIIAFNKQKLKELLQDSCCVRLLADDTLVCDNPRSDKTLSISAIFSIHESLYDKICKKMKWKKTEL